MNATILLKCANLRINGEASIVMRYYENKRQTEINLGISIMPSDWDASKARVKKKHNLSCTHNLLIDSALNKANEIIFQAKLVGRSVSVDDFRAMYIQPEKSFLLLKYIDTMIAELTSMKIITDESANMYRTVRKHIEAMQPGTTFEECAKLEYINKFEKYLIGQNIEKNGRAKYHVTLKSIFNKAIRADMMTLNPYTKFTIRTEKTKVVYLERHELVKLEALRQANTLSVPMAITLNAYLFACYTGLRYSDISQLEHSDIVSIPTLGTMRKALSFRIQKTKEYITIPLSVQALAIIDQSRFAGAKLIPITANAVVNRHLKVIAEQAGIKKGLHFHTARHTFATISLSLGADLKTISKLLGHSRVTTTEIYAQVMDRTRFAAIDSWAQL